MVDIWATSTNQKLLLIIKIIISPYFAIFVDSTKWTVAFAFSCVVCIKGKSPMEEPTFTPLLCNSPYNSTNSHIGIKSFFMATIF